MKKQVNIKWKGYFYTHEAEEIIWKWSKRMKLNEVINIYS
jgi:hypothetical protein